MYTEMIPFVAYLMVIVGLGFAISAILFKVFELIDDTVPRILGLYFCVLCVIYIFMNIVVWKG